ncbi:MAG TPA: aspartate-semialdehyde dehydrogenase [Holophagaceae bacterium]|nr:aspartate-semialdehyde dehydrogenase [Holophagaceae bacterium]
MTSRIPVTILGATGVVGQRFARRLAQHPLFEIAHLAASERSAGRRYADACAWRLDGDPYAGLGDRILVDAAVDTAFAPVVFSALDSGPASELEPAFARAGALVFSNASAFRMDPDVPLLVPEVNADHLALLERQKHRWPGGIVCNPNCTATVLVMALAPLEAAFGIEAVLMTSLQAVSGAGYPGVSSLDILGNVIPFIRNEEEKVEEEVPKLLGRLLDGALVPTPLAVSALCHRVPVLEGHTEAVSVRLRGNPSIAQVREALHAWRPEPQRLGLPSAPEVPIRLHDLEDRPQVRRDVEQDGGMSVHVGRLRPCPILGIKFSLLGHNTERGAAGGSVLNAELAQAKGLLRARAQAEVAR